MFPGKPAHDDAGNDVTAPTPLNWRLPGGSAWSLVVPGQRAIRLTALGIGPCVSMLMYVDGERSERLNVPDTLKAQMSACIRPGMVLMSDMGRALASVTGSSLDWHDAITGHSTDAHLARYGPSSYAADRNEWRRSSRDSLLQELAKHDLSARDLHASVNWFTKVAPAGDETGTLRYCPGHAADADWVELRTELDVLVVLATSPHPMEPSAAWQPAAVAISIGPTPRPSAVDRCRLSRDEAGRALALSERGSA